VHKHPIKRPPFLRTEGGALAHTAPSILYTVNSPLRSTQMGPMQILSPQYDSNLKPRFSILKMGGRGCGDIVREPTVSEPGLFAGDSRAAARSRLGFSATMKRNACRINTTVSKKDHPSALSGPSMTARGLSCRPLLVP